jgi:hypothetical protein
MREPANLLDRWLLHRRPAPPRLQLELSSTISLPPLRTSIRIDATLDLRDALLVLQDHRDDGNDAAYDKGHDRHQQSTQTHDRINQPHKRLRKPRIIGQRPSTIGQQSSANDRFSGGADRDRTGGLLVANQALSQLSYSPNLAISIQSSAIS